MTMSIRSKLLALSLLLVLLSTVGSSIAYYVLTTQDKHRESQQQIEIALEIILEDLAEEQRRYLDSIQEFFRRDDSLTLTFLVYSGQPSERLSLGSPIVRQVNVLSYVSGSDRVRLYGADNALVLTYRPESGTQEALVEWAEKDGETFPGDIPAVPHVSLFSSDGRIGIRVTAPLLNLENIVGAVVAERELTQAMVAGYAELSQTDINMFANNQFSIGTLPLPGDGAPRDLEAAAACAPRRERTSAITLTGVEIAQHEYYEGRCALMNGEEKVGAISIYLSQEIERQAVWKILRFVLLNAGIVAIVAIGLSLVFSRGTLHSIQHIVTVMDAASSGDLRPSALATTHDEIGTLTIGLNRMVGNLREITRNVQSASYEVHSTADSILQDMLRLVIQMESQSTSVEATTVSVETITEFIHAVEQNTGNLLSASSQILASIQQTTASIEDVTTSTHSLTTNLQQISASLDQVNQSGKHISGKAGELDTVARNTAAEIHQIDQSLKDVSHDADRTQELAKDTLEAATSGQTSVENAIQGMAVLKDVVSNTADIIREVNAWSERVSSILGIVDNITDQTSLLALNASIISAQAGSHGRGFAVVANEIKELATRTQASTKEIATLIHELRKKTEEGVQHTTEGLSRSDQAVELAYAVKDALTSIQEHATRSSQRAENTARVIQQTVDSSQTISTSIQQVTAMVSDITENLHTQERDIDMVFEAVENISGMAAQVNRSMLEQKRTAVEIGRSMGEVTEQFSTISVQTGTLLQDSDQIVEAMHLVKSTTDDILREANHISQHSVQHLTEQSEILQQIVQSFKIS